MDIQVDLQTVQPHRDSVTLASLLQPPSSPIPRILERNRLKSSEDSHSGRGVCVFVCVCVCVCVCACVAADTFTWLSQEKPIQEKQVAVRDIPDAECSNHTRCLNLEAA